jgi:hypothetical protein
MREWNKRKKCNQILSKIKQTFSDPHLLSQEFQMVFANSGTANGIVTNVTMPTARFLSNMPVPTISSMLNQYISSYNKQCD